MSDVLSFVVPTFPGGGTKYPSVNQLGRDDRRGGRKSSEYLDLFRAVRAAAWEAMKATGWETAEDLVELHLKRYIPDLRRADRSNLGKCEADAMEPGRPGDEQPDFPGVYRNDHLVRPFPDIVRDLRPGAVDRIAIVVIRAALPHSPAANGKPAKAKRAALPEPILTPISSDASQGLKTTIPEERFALLNGKRVPWDKALEMIHREARR